MRLNFSKPFKIIRFLLNKHRFKTCGNNITIASGVKIFKAGNLEIGSNVRLGEGTTINASGGVKIGNNVSFAREVLIWTSSHNYYSPETLPFDKQFDLRPVEIKDNVWLGARCTIIPGVTIEEGAVVAMGSVVTQNVPKGAVVGGNPAKILKYRDLEKYDKLKSENKFINVGI